MNARTKMTAQATPPTTALVSRTSKLMEEGWKGVQENFIPPETHPDLVKTFKRFFYAGAKHLIDDLLYAANLDEGNEPTPEDLSKIDAVIHEINAFFSEVASGRQ
jgi:hypothetical protein